MPKKIKNIFSKAGGKKQKKNLTFNCDSEINNKNKNLYIWKCWTFFDGRRKFQVCTLKNLLFSSFFIMWFIFFETRISCNQMDTTISFRFIGLTFQVWQQQQQKTCIFVAIASSKDLPFCVTLLFLFYKIKQVGLTIKMRFIQVIPTNLYALQID